MSRSVQLRRGTAAQNATFTGRMAELTVDTDGKVLILHDGTTVGGIKLASQAYVLAQTVTPGPKGDTGNTGAKGDKGDTGDTGKDAYQEALDLGFVGTLQDWLDTFKGQDGTNGLGFLPTPPSSEFGQTGDLPGQVSIDSQYLYVCTAPYISGLNPIWTRTPLSGTW